jgi:hypothetical protein
MTIVIPTWLLWAVGLAIGLPVLAGVALLAWLGWRLSSAFSSCTMWR